jgi:hypothetical protein
MQHWSRFELIASAVAAAVGLSFGYLALYGQSRHDAAATLLNLGVVFSAFSIALSPRVLRAPVQLTGKDEQGKPILRGAPGLCSTVSILCFLLAAVCWLAKLFMQS